MKHGANRYVEANLIYIIVFENTVSWMNVDNHVEFVYI